MGGFVWIIGIPREMGNVLHSARLAFDAGIVALMAIVASSSSALRASVPGETHRADRILPLGVFVTWILVTVGQLINATAVNGPSALTPDAHFACAGLVTGLAAVLSVPLTLILRRAAPLDKWWCGAPR